VQEEVLLQLFLGSAPSDVKSLFPDKFQDGLVVFTYCSNCMNSGEKCHYRIYEAAQLDILEFAPAPPNCRIEAKIIVSWIPFQCLDGSSEHFLEVGQPDGLTDVGVEEFIWRLRQIQPRTWLLGHPWYCQGEYDLEDGLVLLSNFEQDANFSMMWGDAGAAHLWMGTGGQFGNFELHWQCG
jgi:hypothetical protein